MMAVLGASAKASLDKTLAEDIVADYVVSNAGRAAVLRLGRRRDRAVSRGWPRWRGSAARCSRSTGTATSPRPSSPQAVTGVARPEVVTGSLDDLGASSVAISTGFAND